MVFWFAARNKLSFDMLWPGTVGGSNMPDDVLLHYIEKQIHLIASDCFDPRAKDRLQELRHGIARYLTTPPSVQSRETDRGPDVTGQ
jgi:hypothetical protein